MTIIELAVFVTLSSSVAFCFVFRRSDAFQLAFAGGMGAFLIFFIGALLISGVLWLFRRGTAPRAISETAESPRGLFISRFFLVAASLLLVLSVVSLGSHPVLSGLAAITAWLVALFGCPRDRPPAFICLGVTVLLSIVAHIVLPPQKHLL